jgi:hypothetical protein
MSNTVAEVCSVPVLGGASSPVLVERCFQTKPALVCAESAPPIREISRVPMILTKIRPSLYQPIRRDRNARAVRLPIGADLLSLCGASLLFRDRVEITYLLDLSSSRGLG